DGDPRNEVVVALGERVEDRGGAAVIFLRECQLKQEVAERGVGLDPRRTLLSPLQALDERDNELVWVIAIGRFGTREARALGTERQREQARDDGEERHGPRGRLRPHRA